MTKFKTIDEYINAQLPESAKRLTDIRNLFHKLIPNTEESIRYNLPAFTVGEHHLYISTYQKHIGLYPMYGIPELDNEMLPLRGKGTKDALHFEHSRPMPMELIEKIIIAKMRV